MRLKIEGRRAVAELGAASEDGSTEVVVDGERLRFDEITIDGRYLLLRRGGELARIPYYRDRDKVWLSVNGRSYAVAAAHDESGDGDEETGGFQPEIESPMPGKVLQVMVQEGDEVEPDAALVVLEAMKMEQTVRSPGAAKVVRVHVTADAMVGPGETLVTLEARE